PPLNLNPKWAGQHLGYTIAKYGMSLVTLGLAEELRDRRIAANSRWPRTTIATAAGQNLLGGALTAARSGGPQTMADAAYDIRTRAPATCTGSVFTGDEDLAEAGVTNMSVYGPPREELGLDLFPAA